MPRVTQAHLDARRRQILRAAASCFARRGFHETTVQEIADEADLSAGALYRYFDGKEALVEALAEWGREGRREVLDALEPGGGPEPLARLIGTMVAFLGGEGAAEAASLDVRLWGEALGQPRLRAVVEGELAALVEPIAAHVAAEVDAGRMRPAGTPEALARVLVAAVMGLELQKALDPAMDPSGEAGALRTLLEGLAPAPA